METKLLIIGKGDNIITMILDNLYSNNSTPEVHIFNNLNLPILNTFEHDEFDIKVFEDIKELMELKDEQGVEIRPLESTKEYQKYLHSLTQEQLLPHVYLNYLAIMFGGQMMKAKTPGSGKMYEFDGDMREIAGSIRAIQKDEWADEANKALDYNINILDELQRVSESASNEVEVDGGEGA